MVPTGLQDSLGKNTGVDCHFPLQCMKVKSESEVAQSCLHGLQPSRLLRPWDFPGKSTGVGCHCLLQKKAEHQRIDAFELWWWRRLLRVLWTARKSNQSILKEISPEYSLEGLMLKLKLQYFGHLMQRTDSLEKTLMLGKTEGRRKRG